MKITINDKEININEEMTILDAAKKAGINIPTLCYIKDLFPTGACRMCVVEVEGQNNLVASCSQMITDGMKIKTHSSSVMKKRKTILELILGNHPDDCLYCDRNGNCDLRKLAHEFNIKERSFKNISKPTTLDYSSPSMVRDNSKCILCGRCVRICEEVQSVSAIDFTHRGEKAKVTPFLNMGLNESPCIHCGQCLVACPTGALSEKDSILEVLEQLRDSDNTVMVQHAPSISVTLAEHYNLDATADAEGILNAALRKIGFHRVFDTSFSADLTIMEEASEFISRVKSNTSLPLLSSCSPGWIKFVEQYFPNFIPNLSSCKSPQQMMGAVIKHIYAPKVGIDPKKVFSVSVMPCTAKKFERQRPEHLQKAIYDVDSVLTTRELIKLIDMLHIDYKNLVPEEADSPLGEYSSAGKIFGTSGGVMEAAVRTAHHLLTGKNIETLEFKEMRKAAGIKEASLKINGLEIKIAIVSGLNNAKTLLEQIQKGEKNYHFIEVMTCPGGCIAGGGQPHGADEEKIKARMKRLYSIDKNAKIRFSHENPSIIKLYQYHLGEPLSKESHRLLHTHYSERVKG